MVVSMDPPSQKKKHAPPLSMDLPCERRNVVRAIDIGGRRKAQGCGTMCCVGVPKTKSYLFPHVAVSLTVMFVVPQLRFAMSLSWVTPSTHVFSHCKFQPLCWALYCSSGTSCRSNMKLTAKKLLMRLLHSTTFVTRTPPHLLASMIHCAHLMTGLIARIC